MKVMLLAACLVLVSTGTEAQSLARADSLYRGAENALASGDTTGYARLMDAAAKEMPADHLNRPWVQYHAARALAMTGDARESARWLGLMLDEDLEGLMAWFATLDPAFGAIRTTDPFRRVLSRMDRWRVAFTPLRDSLYLVTGAGGNSVIWAGREGTLVVDPGYQPGGAAIGRALRARGTKPVRWIILTHGHEDHVGGTDVLAAEAARVLAHPETIRALRNPRPVMDGVTPPARVLAIEPVQERLVLSSDGEEVEVLPMPAHSGGDILVWFPGARVLHAGDNFLPGANPRLELGSVPDLLGYLEAMGQLLDRLPAGTRVVPGHGPVVPADSLCATYQRTQAAVEFVRERKAAGASLESTVEMARTRELPRGWVERTWRTLP